MKRFLMAVCIIYFFINSSAIAQSVIVNSDGTHSIVIDNGSTSTIVNPDGTHSIAIKHGSTSTIVNPNGTHSIVIDNGSTSTIVNPDGTHSTLINHGGTFTLVKPDGTSSILIPSENAAHLAVAYQNSTMPFFSVFLIEFLKRSINSQN